MDKLTFGSLFAGIGGFDLGFERAGMICKWQVEINDYATKVLAKHWPNVHRERDIRECGSHNLEAVDVICGGFPCQDISYAGRGAGLDGERSGLFFEAIRLVRELQPRAVVLENVAALLTRGLDRVLGTLAEVGFDAEWHCIPAAAVGAPHIRDRVFVVAYAGSKQQQQERQGYGCNGEWMPEFATRIGASGKDINRRHSGQFERPPEVAQMELANSNGNRFDKGRQRVATAWSHGPIRNDWWESEPAVGRVANGIPARVDRLRGLGNAVVPQVAEYVGRRVVETLTA